MRENRSPDSIDSIKTRHRALHPSIREPTKRAASSLAALYTSSVWTSPSLALFLSPPRFPEAVFPVDCNRNERTVAYQRACPPLVTRGPGYIYARSGFDERRGGQMPAFINSVLRDFLFKARSGLLSEPARERWRVAQAAAAFLLSSLAPYLTLFLPA